MYKNNPNVMKANKKLYRNRCITDVYWKDFKHLKPDAARRSSMYTASCDSPKYLSCGVLVKIWLKQVIDGLKQLFYQGSLHGVKYIFEPSFNNKERLTWVIIVAISVGFCVANIIQLFGKWTSSPFVNVMDSLYTPVWAVPFPSVVLCPQMHVKLSVANVSNLDRKHKVFASLICPQMSKAKKNFTKGLDATGQKEFEQFVLQASPTCSDLVKKCYWGTADDDSWMTEECCSKIFRPVFTNYGLCYAFNSLPLNGMSNITHSWHRTFDVSPDDSVPSWNLDEGYPQNFSITDHPIRAMAAGEQYGFSAELFLNSSEHQYACDGSIKGFNVLIKSPTDHAYTSTVIRLPMDRMTSVEVTPQTYKTDSSLRKLRPEQRQCYFQNERSLLYYSMYTDSNCKHDLILKQVVRICGCVPYNWPRRHSDDLICTSALDFQCINNVNDEVVKDFILSYFAEIEDNKGKVTIATACYPSCNDIIYSSQVFYSNLEREPGAEVLSNMRDTEPGQVTRLNVHFYDDMFLGLHRYEQYDDYYFVGAIGGLLSLFLGFSIISLAEVVFFVILRPLQIVFGLAYHQLYHTHRN